MSGSPQDYGPPYFPAFFGASWQICDAVFLLLATNGFRGGQQIGIDSKYKNPLVPEGVFYFRTLAVDVAATVCSPVL